MPYTYGLFKEVDSKSGAKTLLPNKNAGVIDVVNDYSWTLSPRTAREEVPQIELVEWKLQKQAIVSSFNRYAYAAEEALKKKGLGVSDAPYFGLYPSMPTKFRYKFPYYSETYRTLRNAWENADALTEIPLLNRLPVIGQYLQIHGVEALTKAFYVGVGREIPKAYTAGHAESVDVAFVLNNTTSISDVIQNWELIHLLSYQNVQNRQSFIVVEPPVIYTYKIDSQKYCPACYVSDMTVGNLGQTKKYVVGGRERQIPEAWAIKITFTDLIPVSQNILGAMAEENFSLIEATQNFTQAQIKDLVNKTLHPPEGNNPNDQQPIPTLPKQIVTPP